MKIPYSSYEKLYSEVLLKDFPELERIEVVKPDFPFSIIMGIKVNLYLKPPEQIKSMLSCKYLIGMFKGRVGELNKYFGEKTVVDINVYYDGELLCHDILNW